MKKSELRQIIKEELLKEGVKVSDITAAYKSAQVELDNANKACSEAARQWRIVSHNAPKEGEALNDKFMTELCGFLGKKLNIKKIPNVDSLMEFYVDNGKGKLSIRNRKWFSQYTGYITCMIRDEQTLFNKRCVIDESFDAKKASDFIFKEIKIFEPKHAKFRSEKGKGDNIKWFK